MDSKNCRKAAEKNTKPAPKQTQRQLGDFFARPGTALPISVHALNAPPPILPVRHNAMDEPSEVEETNVRVEQNIPLITDDTRATTDPQIDFHNNHPTALVNNCMIKSTASELINHIQAIAAHLPDTVPVGTQSDIMAIFAVPGADFAAGYCIDGEDDRDSLENVLTEFLGYDASNLDELASRIRRGLMGIDGFCNVMNHFIDVRNLDCEYALPRLERLLNVMKKL